MKRTKILRKRCILIALIVGVLLVGYVIHQNSSLNWPGVYKETFTTLDEKDNNFYIKLSPKVEIEESDGYYSIKITLMTSRVPVSENVISGQVGGTHYIPVNIPIWATGRHVIFATKYNEADEDMGLYCELRYIDEKHVEFRYAKTKEELINQEFYTLVKIKYNNKF